METLFLLIVFLPLIGAIIAGVGGTLALKAIGSAADHHEHAGDDGHHHAYDGPRWPALLTTGLLLFCAVLSWIAFFDVAMDITLPLGGSTAKRSGRVNRDKSQTDSPPLRASGTLGGVR